ncbi:hypothetical protein HHK36_003783 [Tetracentron sinense]|uniref:Uncharacterized protein n=1 Tax=Tetracentron sinense TaxID=13715 RepID=A0A834ZPX7_TETSI|nr:hypothetical protein HHK36_003783 [Tetracentron sinense]
MSILQYSDSINAPELQIWNNATFDDGDVDESTDIKSSSYQLQSICVNRSETLECDSSKENQSPAFCKSPVSVKSPIPIKPLCPNGAIGNSQGKPLKLLFKQDLRLPSPTVAKNGSEALHDDRKIDTEIEEIELEISRLSSKLEALRIEKLERNMKTIERRGRIVPAKFMEQKQISKNSTALKWIEEPPSVSASKKFHRRGVSLGPSEIIAGVRSRQMGKQEITPIQSIQSRRKSCFWKLQEIDEEKVTKQRGRNLSLSPKSRTSIYKIQASRKGFTTVGSKKHVKKDDMVLSCVQPKKLFREEEKLVSAKKSIKSGRVVASRYNQIPIQLAGNSTSIDCRKRSLPENDNDDSKWCDKKRASSVGKSHGSLPETGQNQVNANRAKKRWDISSAAMGHKNLVDSSPPSILKFPDLLPKNRTIRCTKDSSRDSGPAKRVAELTGR